MTRGKQLNSANVLTSKDQHSMRLGPLGRADDNEFVSATDEDPTELANKIGNERTAKDTRYSGLLCLQRYHGPWRSTGCPKSR